MINPISPSTLSGRGIESCGGSRKLNHATNEEGLPPQMASVASVASRREWTCACACASKYNAANAAGGSEENVLDAAVRNDQPAVLTACRVKYFWASPSPVIVIEDGT